MANSAEIPPLPGSDGELTVFHRGLDKHYAVNVGNGEIVHVTSSDHNELTSAVARSKEAWKFKTSSVSSTFDKAVIKKEKFENYVKAGDNVYVETSREKPFPSEEIVKRANSKLSPMDYRLLGNNCEHFTFAVAAISGLVLLWILATDEESEN
ncbi:uncharacterized protein LOC111341261 [Stylophora pistillata]|uniref:uncharacterized protein LOC111341261 n=1 Tax=Stylophora pistillata TaxID=50429 RepID=UPI000C039378|nr:uncharacterized protein LOC111341261 [Stylophora pistillata]